MYRKGKYTRKRGVIGATKYNAKRAWKWWKALPLWKKILYTTGPVIAFLIIVPIITYIYFYNDIGDVDRLLNRNNTGVVLLDKHGKQFFSTGNSAHRDLLPLDKISDHAEDALIAAEDKNFYEHGGFSPLGIMRAMYSNVISQEIAGGGSTITQQLAKNTLLTKNQTILRKYQELTIAMAIEQRYSKEQILSMYLNSVYYGENAFGIEAAAKTYFNKKASKLTVAESAMLIGVLPAPSAYSPISGNPEYAKTRQEYVLGRMLAENYITEKEYNKAMKQKLRYAKRTGIVNDAPHFTELVLNELYEKYGEERVERSGYQVMTTLDLKTQKIANTAVANHVDFIQANGGSNASVTVIDPKTGAIRAMVGSVDYTNDKFGNVNMSTTPRQPGSSFKPIYYSQALADGVITPTTVYNDKPTDFGGGYMPMNASRSNYGKVTVRQALNWSLNIPSVMVMRDYGVDKSIQGAKDLGITSLDDNADYGLALALGTAETSAVEMTNAYAAFANGGRQYDTSIIEKIEDKYDSTIFTSSPESHRAISEQGAYLISNILSDNATRARIFGTTLSVTGTDFQTKIAAVKTGTTEESRDAWTIGYNPNVAVGVWVGNNDNTPMLNGGSSMAGPIWQEIMGQLIGDKNAEFIQPSGVIKKSVCTEVGTLTDVFLVSHIPKECNKEPKKEEKKKVDKKTDEEETKPCTVAGKEDLASDDPDCIEEFCEIEGKEDLAANDPECKEEEPLDTDGDGVSDDIDECPETPEGIPVNEVGCATVPIPEDP